jgi:hypothetical protein
MTFKERYIAAVRKEGEVFAAIGYILASVALMMSAMSLDKVFDTSAGAVWFIVDLFIIMLKMMEYPSVVRSLVMFLGSVAGSLLFLGGAISKYGEVFSPYGTFEAGAQILSSLLMLAAGIGGCFIVLEDFSGKRLMGEKLRGFISSHIGTLYLIAFSVAFIFALAQFFGAPSIPAAGYVLASVLWIWASDCIRRRFQG